MPYLSIMTTLSKKTFRAAIDYYHNIINNKINSRPSLGLVNFNIPLY